MSSFDDNTDLDQAAPDRVARVLRKAAQKFYEGTGELQSAWQDKNAGLIWTDLARILERAADQCERACQKRGL